MSDTEGVRQLYDMPRQIPGPGVISGGQTPDTGGHRPPNDRVGSSHSNIGAAKVEPVQFGRSPADQG